MARQQIVSYSYMCDVCGTEIPESDAATASRKISWGSGEFAIDLCAAHQAELTETLDRFKLFVDAGRRNVPSRRRAAGAGTTTTASTTSTPRARRGSGRAATKPSTGSGRSDLSDIRAWAQANGYQLGDRGRIAATIVAAYDAAQPSNGDAESSGSHRTAQGSAPADAPADDTEQDVEPWRAMAMESSGSST